MSSSRKRLPVCLVLALLLLAYRAAIAESEYDRFERIVVVPGETTDEVQLRYVELFRDRMREQTDAAVVVGNDVDDAHALHIRIGLPETHAALRRSIERRRDILFPDDQVDPGPEGFALHRIEEDGVAVVLAAGVDRRGVLYVVGALLRAMRFEEHAILFPQSLSLRTSPAFEIRGAQAGQGARPEGVRRWTAEEHERTILDFALAGCNTIQIEGGVEYDFVKKYGLKTLFERTPNQGDGPEEWRAAEAIGRTYYLCPSISEARAALLAQHEAFFKDSPAHDYLRMKAGDGGGCECDLCAPFGAVYIHLAADIAEIVHRYHPDTKIFISNQKMDNAGDLAMLRYLQEAPRDWVYAWEIGPGSNAMSWMPGKRQDHRMDLFRYAAFGQMDRYFRELIHQMPPRHHLVFFTNITHWTYSQYSLLGHEIELDRNDALPPAWDRAKYAKRPDPALEQVYGRATFHARPRDYYHVFRETMRYTIGDVAHSAGQHDHFNNWMWQRLLWAPNTPLEDVVRDYARFWFGPEAAPAMAEALFQLEENLSTPLADNPGVDRYYALVVQAGHAMTPRRMANSHLWRQHMQKAALDKYSQLLLRRQLALRERMETRLARALDTDAYDAAIAETRAWLDAPLETDVMAALRAQAGVLGDESEALFGVRSEGYYNLEQDFIGLGWFRRQLARAADGPPEAKRAMLELIVHYQDPGEGGYYDNAGAPDESPHLSFGWPFSGGPVSPENLPSQRRMAFTAEHSPGLTFNYDDLDPDAAYRLRVSLVRPVFLERYAMRHPQRTQSIYADGQPLALDIEVPEFHAEIFEFDIPRTVTQDGALEITFEKGEGIGEWPEPDLSVWRNTGGWGAIVSEVWVMKRQ